MAGAAGFSSEPMPGIIDGRSRMPSTISLKSVLGRNFGTRLAALSMMSPVAGLRTWRAARSTASNTPRPLTRTLSPSLMPRWMTSTTASSAFSASLRVPSMRLAISSMSSALFTGASPGRRMESCSET